MAQTQVKWGSPLAVKRWGTSLAVEQTAKSYFEQKFIGTDQNNIIQRRQEIETDAGDRVSFDLSVQLRGDVTYGDNRLEGKEEQLRFYTDEVIVDQVRKAVSAGGAMTRKRTVHNLRQTAKDRSSDYWAQYFDEILFVYLSGARGVDADYVLPADFKGIGNPPNGFEGDRQNGLQPPDAGHYFMAGSAVSKQTLTADDTMTRELIERVNTGCTMLRANDPNTSNMVPVTNAGSNNFVLLMSPYQAHDLRVETGTGNWLDVQKALTQAAGTGSNIFKGGLGMIGGTVLHSHEKVVRFSDYGAGANVDAARALFMGRQAGIIAYGQGGGSSRFTWVEQENDYNNEPTVASGTIFGVKKSRFNGKDFGVISIDTAAKNPNAVAA